MAKTSIKTKAIVLQSVKYGDNSLVVKMFTEDAGLQSFMVKGVFGKKSKMKAALFQNMTLLEIVADIDNNSLGFIREITLLYSYKSIHSDFKKTTIIIFINELLSKSINESETDTSMFQFVYNFMIGLDETTSNCSNFPVYFALSLSHYLGFYPNIDSYKENFAFDLFEANFKEDKKDIYQIDTNTSKLLYLLCKYIKYHNYTLINKSNLTEEIQLDNKSRRQLLEAIVTYYKLHADNIRDLKSYEILKTLFN